MSKQLIAANGAAVRDLPSCWWRGASVCAFLVCTAVLGCGGSDPVQGPVGCRVDDDCLLGFACAGRTCVARARGERAFVVQLLPPWDAPVARADLGGVRFSGETSLRVPARMDVSVALIPSDLSSAVTDALDARLLGEMKFRREFDGLPALTAEGPVLTVGGGGGTAPVTRAQIAVPAPRLGQAAAITVRHPGPLDRVLPPVSAVLPLAPAVQLPLPGTASVLTLDGNLQSALHQPLAGYQVRAWRTGQVVSNRAVSQVDGGFRLVMNQPPEGQAIEAVDLIVSAIMPGVPVPELEILGFRPGQDSLADLRMPAYPVAKPLRIPVIGVDDEGPVHPVPGALVSFRGVLSDVPKGRVIYRREILTDGHGEAVIGLIPGEVLSTQTYDLRITPPPGGRFASRCVPAYEVVGAGVGGDPFVGVAVELVPRAALTGVITGPDQHPVPRVALTAIRLADETDEAADACGTPPVGTPINTVTDQEGTFTLRLDPGLYRIEYRPLDGSHVATKIETLAIARDMQRMITLPAGRLAEGRVVGPEGQAVARCQVRIYTPDPTNAVVFPIAQATTDSNGRFRAVVPESEAPMPVGHLGPGDMGDEFRRVTHGQDGRAGTWTR